MNLQVLKDNMGNETGVFVPIEDWRLIKRDYPDIERLDEDIQQWEKDLIDERLEQIEKDPSKLKSGLELLAELKRKV